MVAARLAWAYDAASAHITLTYHCPVELKTARLTVLIDPAKKAAFEQLCARQDLTPSQVVRQLIRDYLAHYGAHYVPSGVPPGDAGDATSGASER
jgi:Ribbon-helix-helix protein